MTAQQLLKRASKVKFSKINKQQVVTIPRDVYDDLLEYVEMYTSEKYKKDIAEARREISEGKTVTFEQLKKELNL